MKTYLKDVDVKSIIEEWDNKTIDEFANEYNVNRNTIILMAKEVNELNPEKCKPKKRSRRTRKSVAEAALAML